MKVLLAEDNQDHRNLLEIIIRSGDDESAITSVDTGTAFLDRLNSQPYDVALLDYHLPDCDAAEILPKIDQVPNCPPIIVISSESDSETIITSLRSGGRDFLPKSEAFEAVRLLDRIREALKRKRNEERVIEEQKDECLSVLAGGIAHDFNNMLVGILGKAALMDSLVERDSKQHEYCEGIQRTAQRLADLAKQLLAYARGGKYQPKAMNPNNAALDTLAMLKGTIRSSIEVRTFLSPDLWTVRADHSQIVQALLNLCLNACDAMSDQGTLSIFTENVTKHQTWSCRLNEHHPAGEYVHVVVADTGCGISRSVCERMFEPYYSTKGDSRGLGLAAVQGIVRNHNGALTLATQEGRGTAFHIYLPRLCASVERERDCAAAAPRTPAMHVLLVEDDDEVREIAQEILASRGHAVEAAATGQAAIDAYRAQPDKYAVVLLDMRLPDLGGAEVFRQCQAVGGAARFVVCSGYDRAAVLSGLLAQDDRVSFLPKPFTPDQLIQSVESAAVVA